MTELDKKPETIAMVTGATGAIGEAIATLLAREAGWEVVLICRDQERGLQAAEDIRGVTGNPNIRVEVADLSSEKSIRALANRWKRPLHVLVNNAAECPRSREETPEGIERQFATNVLGYFRMIQAMTPALKEAAPSRVVNVASYWAGDLDLDDLEFRRRPYDNDTAYRQSKQANRMLTLAFANRLQPLGISVNACHPGDVRSNLSTSLGFGGHETPEHAAATPAWLAISTAGIDYTGRYFERRGEKPCRFCQDHGAVEKLYRICEGYSAPIAHDA